MVTTSVWSRSKVKLRRSASVIIFAGVLGSRHLPGQSGERDLLSKPVSPQLELADGFVVATGFECSAPVIAGGIRQDEIKKTGHWERFGDDFSLAASFGISFVRFGLPFHVICPSDDASAFDWRWADNAMLALRDAGLEPILDMLHFGLPDDISAVGDPRLVRRYEVYAAAVAERYPWVRYYTPVNEPLVTASFSAHLGMWNERRSDDRSFVAAIENAARCAVRGMELIRERRQDAIFIQSDGCESYSPSEPLAVATAEFLNVRRFLGWDLTYGRRPDASVERWLLTNGMASRTLDWFAEHGTSSGCIVGHDYYRGNEWRVRSNGSIRFAGRHRRGYLALAREHHARYGMPFMLTETNTGGSVASSWLAEVWNDALTLRAEGLPIRGFCWYGLIDHVDWDSGLTRARGRVNHCGLAGIDRRPHRVGSLYRDLALNARADRFEPLTVQAGSLAPLEQAA